MELSELSLRVGKLEEIIQELAKWTNFNLKNNPKESSANLDGERIHQNKNRRFLEFLPNVAKSAGETEMEDFDPFSSVVIKMELEDDHDDERPDQNVYDDQEIPQDLLPETKVNVELEFDALSNPDEDSLFIPSDGGENSAGSDFESLPEPPKKRRKPSTKRKYDALKVPPKSSLSPSEPFVSLRPLTPSQIPTHLHKKEDRPNKEQDLICSSCPRIFTTKSGLSNHIRVGPCRRAFASIASPRHPQHPFKCTECPQTCKLKKGLTRHIRFSHRYKERNYHCDYCPYLGTNLVKLKYHLKTKHKNPILTCYFCPWIGKRIEKFTCHLRIHTGEKPYKCPHCIYTSRKDSNLERHVKTVHSEEEGAFQFQCSECPCKFKSQTSLEKHLRVRHNAGDKCGICEFVGSNYASLRDHLDCHKTEDGKMQCPHCPKTCKNRATLVVHVRMHTGERPYKCGKCSNTYRDKIPLRKHEINCQSKGRNPVNRPFACPHCPYASAGKGKLSDHILSIHPANEDEEFNRPFKCLQCPSTFRLKKDLLRHIIYLHKNTERIFLCDSCPYLAANKNHLLCHFNNRHKDPSFKCYFCKSMRRQSSNLVEHMRIHTGEKPWKCPHCIFTTPRHTAMKLHVKRFHSEEENLN